MGVAVVYIASRRAAGVSVDVWWPQLATARDLRELSGREPGQQCYSWDQIGPALTALAYDLLHHASGSVDVARWYADLFAVEVLGRLDPEQWTLSRDAIMLWVGMSNDCVRVRVHSHPLAN